MSRRQLPNRRPLFTGPALQWAGVHWLVGVGFDELGAAVEVWVDPADLEARVDAEIVALVHEAAITASHLLQAGTSAKAQADRLTGNSPGLLALMLRQAAEIEIELGSYVKTLHRITAERELAGAVDARPYLEDFNGSLQLLGGGNGNRPPPADGPEDYGGGGRYGQARAAAASAPRHVGRDELDDEIPF